MLWDVHHPYRDKGESPAESIKNLGAYVKHVHLRDSNDADTYNLIGEGTFPVKEVMDALRSIDYDNFISLEWKPEWMDDITSKDIIFPHFENYMRCCTMFNILNKKNNAKSKNKLRSEKKLLR